MGESISELLKKPASDFVEKEALMMDSGTVVREAASAMKATGAESVIVTSDGRPVGMVTERDLCYRVLAMGLDPSKVRLEEVMTKPLITMAKDRTLGEALRLMAERGTRRVVLVEPDGSVHGIVTRWGFTGERVHTALPLPVSHSGGGLVCPFCASSVESPEALSKHIDTVHIGAELSGGRPKFWVKKERVQGVG
jgi:CBS domain-containing protein